jgi:hypothetical protein
MAMKFDVSHKAEICHGMADLGEAYETSRSGCLGRTCVKQVDETVRDR